MQGTAGGDTGRFFSPARRKRGLRHGGKVGGENNDDDKSKTHMSETHSSPTHRQRAHLPARRPGRPFPRGSRAPARRLHRRHARAAAPLRAGGADHRQRLRRSARRAASATRTSTSRCCSRIAASSIELHATRRRWPSSTARSSAASPNCCSRSCATSSTPRPRSSTGAVRPRAPPQGITNAVFELLRNARILRPASTRTWWCAGAATRSAATNTTTPRRSATSWACAASTSAPAAARAR